MIALAPERTRKKPGWRHTPDESPVVQVCISMTREELRRIDAFAERQRMSRSELLRRCATQIEDMLLVRGGLCDE